MERVTIRFEQNQRAVTEFEVTVHDELIPLIRDSLAPSVFSDRDGDYLVTFDLEKPVPDVVRYWITGEDWVEEPATTGITPPPGKKVFDWGRRTTIKDKNGVVILLESPHSSETSPALDPYVPAAGVKVGDAGYQLHHKHEALLYLMTQRLGIQFSERTPIVIMNPLPFPASLRVPIKGHESLRDAVWVGAMQLDIFRDNFATRLTSSQPKVIINACTGEKHAMGSPKAISRGLIDQYLLKNGLTSVTRLSYQQSQKKHSHIQGKVPAVKLETEEIQNPDCYVIEVPHPSGWRYKDWFPWDVGYQKWQKKRSDGQQ